MHFGQGDVAFAVRKTFEVSGKEPSKVPSTLSRVPLTGDEKTFRTQVEVPALAIERNGPYWQPASEQLLTSPVCAAVRPLTV
jgi:hypothetical protein